MKLAIVIVASLLALGGAGAWYHAAHAGPNYIFRTAEVARGDMVPTISATGTVEPQEVVDVGAQVAGQILEFGKDVNGSPVDYRSPVDVNTVLARIDDRLYRADKTTADAQMALAQAGLTRAVADLKQMEATRDQTKSDWDRAEKLGPSDALSMSDYMKYKAAFEVAEANVEVGKAAILQARAQIAQAKAAVDRADENLSYCTILSPVKGVIIDRRVNIGQTVVSSLSAPSLFLIAKDLRQIQVWVSVNEADIGNVYTGQPVTFTVDMLPGEVFRGRVGTIRLNATMTQNVVTYTVEVNTDNSEGKLLPYLTANVQFEVARRKDVLLAPNAALRWYPEPDMVPDDIRKQTAEKKKAEESSAQRPNALSNADQTIQRAHKKASSRPTTRPESHEPTGHGTVWINDGKFVKPIKVRTGASDGVMTEIAPQENLPVGAQLVVGEQKPQTDENANTNNPFAPQTNGRGRGR